MIQDKRSIKKYEDNFKGKKERQRQLLDQKNSKWRSSVFSLIDLNQKSHFIGMDFYYNIK